MTLDINAIEARANAATPGEWEADKADQGAIVWRNSRVTARAVIARVTDGKHPSSKKDAAFIASARQDVPALCAEVRELRAALERALALLERVAAWRSGAVGAEWTANLSADIAAFIYQPAKDGSGGAR